LDYWDAYDTYYGMKYISPAQVSAMLQSEDIFDSDGYWKGHRFYYTADEYDMLCKAEFSGQGVYVTRGRYNEIYEGNYKAQSIYLNEYAYDDWGHNAAVAQPPSV